MRILLKIKLKKFEKNSRNKFVTYILLFFPFIHEPQ